MTGWLERAAAERPDALAVADRERRVGYAELREEAAALASGLGSGPGDRVEIRLEPGVDLAIALHAAISSGATAQVLAHELGRGVEVIAGAHPGSQPPLARVMTSGTSGEPRPVDLSPANFEASARASADRLGTEPGDRWLCCLPPFHIGGLSILVRSAIYAGAAVIEARFDVDRVAALLEAGKVTIASLVPTQLVRLLDAGAAVGRPRLLLIGGGPLPRDVLSEALDRGATAVQTYGLTEACSQVCTLAPAEARERPGSAGRPLAGTEVRIEDGEILVRGPTVAAGAVASDGWLHTGDLGRLDDDGYLWVEGRRDDLIVSGGENVRPERVEGALRAHPSVADAAVVGIDDREWGQAVVAFVVPAGDEGPSDEELLRLCRRSLSPHEVPKRIERLDRLPRTEAGKVRRAALRARR